jgi:hypothetical protein
MRSIQRTNQVLLVNGIPLILRKVVVEDLDISIERELPRSVGGKEAEDRHRPVGPFVHVPVETSKVYCGDFLADGVYSADASKPIVVALEDDEDGV